MGSTTSELVGAEKATWAVDHALDISTQLRDQQLPLIKNFKSPLKLCSQKRDIHGFDFWHYFITDGTWTIEFGGSDRQSTVLVHLNPYHGMTYCVDTEFDMDQEVRARMRNVCGASAHSLCLRNCEHLARYIQSGTWYSLQMAGATPLRKALVDQMLQQHQALMNTPPAELKPAASEAVPSPVYPDWRPSFAVTFERRLQALSKADEESRVILVLGPTGAGKSTLVNLLLNRKVCEAKTSPQSVTKHMDIIAGSVEIPLPGGARDHRTVRIVDTIGFCDSVIPPEAVLAIVKAFVKTNVLFVEKVLIVCSGRLEPGHAAAIKDFMKWLRYEQQKQNFVFVYNKAEELDQAGRTEAVGVVCNQLGADPTFHVHYDAGDGTERRVNYAFATGFPRRAPLAEVLPDLVQLQSAIFYSREDEKRMWVDASWCSIL